METDIQRVTLRQHFDDGREPWMTTVSIDDKFRDGKNWVWKCIGIGCGHISFVQDVEIEYEYYVPMSDRGKPSYVLTYDEAKRILQCPVYDWKRTYEPTRKVKY